MEAASDGASSSPTTPEAAVVDVKSFTNYLRRIVPLLLEGDPQVPLELDTALKDALHVDYIRKFVSDAQTRSLLVQRTPLKDEEENDETSSTESGAENERERAIYSLDLDVHYTAPKLTSVAFIKRGAIVDADKKITTQIRVINLNEGSPYETLHSYISNAVAPYFKSFVRKSGKADRYRNAYILAFVTIILIRCTFFFISIGVMCNNVNGSFRKIHFFCRITLIVNLGVLKKSVY